MRGFHSIRKRATTKKIAGAEHFSAQQPPSVAFESTPRAPRNRAHNLLSFYCCNNHPIAFIVFRLDGISFCLSPAALSVPPDPGPAATLPVPWTAFASPPKLAPTPETRLLSLNQRQMQAACSKLLPSPRRQSTQISHSRGVCSAPEFLSAADRSTFHAARSSASHLAHCWFSRQSLQPKLVLC